MNVTVHERDNQHLSWEARAMGIMVWDMIRIGFVAYFPEPGSADAYRKELETSRNGEGEQRLLPFQPKRQQLAQPAQTDARHPGSRATLRRPGAAKRSQIQYPAAANALAAIGKARAKPGSGSRHEARAAAAGVLSETLSRCSAARRPSPATVAAPWQPPPDSRLHHRQGTPGSGAAMPWIAYPPGAVPDQKLLERKSTSPHLGRDLAPLINDVHRHSR